MKPILLKITNTPNHSFSIEERKGRAFNYPYHFHPEYELTLIVKGKGTRFVGNNISSFDPSELVLLGKNLPHHWHSDQADEQEESSSVTHQIRQLLDAATKGLKIVGKTSIPYE